MEVYLDNAATSFPKPQSHIDEVLHFMCNVGGSAGRSGHRKATEAGRIVEQTRANLAELLGVIDASSLVFTLNATEALNLAIKGLISPKMHVVTTSIEHNSVIRPLRQLEATTGITITVVQGSLDSSISVDQIARAIQPNTGLIVVNHASNVTGVLLPLEDIAELAYSRRIPLIVDGTQTAGSVPISLCDLPPIYFAFAGHKGLLGAQGTGGLMIPNHLTPPRQLKEGGTGSLSESENQPNLLPDRYESGTLNVLGLAGLKGGTEYIISRGIANIRQHEKELTDKLIEGLLSINRVTVYGVNEAEKRVGVVSFNIRGVGSGDVGLVLDKEYHVMCRTGLHCAPLAHKTIGTIRTGTVRLSVGPFTHSEEIDHVIKAISEIAS